MDNLDFWWLGFSTHLVAMGLEEVTSTLVPTLTCERKEGLRAVGNIDQTEPLSKSMGLRLGGSVASVAGCLALQVQPWSLEQGAGQQVALREQELQQVGRTQPRLKRAASEAPRYGCPSQVLCDARLRDRSLDPGRTENSHSLSWGEMESQAWPTVTRQKDMERPEPWWTCGPKEKANSPVAGTYLLQK